MANSIRHNIMVSVVSSLTRITSTNGYQSTVAFVSENIKHYEQVTQNQFPAVFPIDTNEDRQSFSFPRTSSSQDMKSTLTVLVTSFLFARGGVSTSARSNLLMDIEKAMMNATAMTTTAGILDIRPGKVTTDQGTVENYSIHDQEFQIDYLYNHADGG